MTTVMIVHSTCSRVYIGTYIRDYMISDNNFFYYNQLFETNCFISDFEVINNNLFIIMVERRIWVYAFRTIVITFLFPI